MNLAVADARAGHDNDRWRGTGRLDFRQKKLDQQEVGKIIDSELNFESILGFPVWADHDTSHTDNVVDLRDIDEVLRGSLSDSTQIWEIQIEEAGFNIGVLRVYPIDYRFHFRFRPGTEDERLRIGCSELNS